MIDAYTRMMMFLGRYRWFSWLTIHLFVPVDRFLWRRTGGRWSIAHFGSADRVALPTLLLETTGRRSGQRRTAPVVYLADGPDYVVVASNFGQEHHPAWSLNLLADPSAAVQVNERRLPVVGRRATDAEVQRHWPRLLEVYPTWEHYRTRTDREFRMFVLQPAAAAA